VVHQDLPHGARGDGEEVSPVPGDQTRASELEVGLVHQGGGVERALAVLLSQRSPGETPEVVVHERNQALKCGRLAFVGGSEEPRHFADIELRIAHLWADVGKVNLPAGTGGPQGLAGPRPPS
jgi:hypothetical protein